MKFFDAGQEAHGFIAVGQVATGFFALGQMATGVIAIGQLARGVIAIGQLSIGIFSIGMGSFGVAYHMGLGTGGRGLLPLIPSLNPPRDFPPTMPFAALRASWGDGWVRARIGLDARDRLLLYGEQGEALPVKVSAKMRTRAIQALRHEGAEEVFAHIRRVGDQLISDRMMKIAVPVTQRPSFWVTTAIRVAVLCLLSTATWFLALDPLIEMFVHGKAPSLF